jgi:hypothetical protein
VAEITYEPLVQPPAHDAGVAPADRRTYARWPRWKVALAYGILFGVALGSIWMIDDHVLQATPAATMPR